MTIGHTPEGSPMQSAHDPEAVQAVDDAVLARGIVGKMLATVRCWLPRQNGPKPPGMLADMWKIVHSTADLEAVGDWRNASS